MRDFKDFDTMEKELRRSEKQMTLLFLISNAELSEEYHDWLRINGYE